MDLSTIDARTALIAVDLQKGIAPMLPAETWDEVVGNVGAQGFGMLSSGPAVGTIAGAWTSSAKPPEAALSAALFPIMKVDGIDEGHDARLRGGYGEQNEEAEGDRREYKSERSVEGQRGLLTTVSVLIAVPT